MKITDLDMAEFLDYAYLRSPISHLIEENFDIKYFSGEDGVFMEINLKTPKTQNNKKQIGEKENVEDNNQDFPDKEG